MSKYEGLYTFDVDNHRYIPVGQADGIIDCFKFKHESKEPLTKSEKQIIKEALMTFLGQEKLVGFDLREEVSRIINKIDGEEEE